MHTPAPWTINDMPLPSRKILEIQGNGSVVVANVLLQHGKSRAKYYGIKQIDSETRANAQLIAAAPELLAACKKAKEALGYLEHLGNYSQAYEMLNKAIKKVEDKP